MFNGHRSIEKSTYSDKKYGFVTIKDDNKQAFKLDIILIASTRAQECVI